MMGEDKTVYSPKYVGGGESGYGYGYGGGGAGLLFGLVLGSALNRGHGGFFGGDSCCNTGAELIEGRFDALQNQIQTNNITEQFVATNANINNAARDNALGFVGIQRDICDLGSKTDMQTLMLEKSITSGTQAILDQMCADKISTLEHQNVILANELALEKKMPGTFVAGQVTTAPMCTARDNDNLAILLANQQANSLNLAFNSGIQAGAFGQGQAAAQGLGQGAVQK